LSGAPPGVASRRDAVPAYRTLDGSEIRELVHPDRHAARRQSLAEASVAPGARTQRHRHLDSEEIYYILAGRGRMSLDDARFEVGPGDSIVIPPGSAHCIECLGEATLRFLCCCAPAYAHADTELLETVE
jgi:mannose-6-phosphate isomerase-like protein (cupin superfamily)